MTSLAVRSPMAEQEAPSPETTPRCAARRTKELRTCGGAPVLDLALCLILAVAVTGLLVLAL